MDSPLGNAARLADEVPIKNIITISPSGNYRAISIPDACLPFLSIGWGRGVPTTAGGGGGTMLTELTRRLQLSKLPTGRYRKSPIYIKINDPDESEIPCRFGIMAKRYYSLPSA